MSKKEAGEQIDQRQALESFVERLRETRLMTVNNYNDIDDFRQRVRQQLDQLVYDRLKEIRTEQSSRTTPSFDGEPYPGLRALGAGDEPVFFGRRSETNELCNWLESAEKKRALVALTGASGTGKSSLAMAGVVPRLKRAGWKTAYARLDLRDPVGATVEALQDWLEPEDRDRPNLLAERWLQSPELLVSQFNAAGSNNGEIERRLLVLDQFEEARRLEPAELKRTFAIMETLAAKGGVSLLLTIRADFLADVLRTEEFAGLLRGNIFTLAPPGAEAISEIVRGPAALVGAAVNDSIASELIDAGVSERGALPLLAFALRNLYRPDERCLAAPEASRNSAADEPLLQAVLASYIAKEEVGLPEDMRTALPDLFRELVTVTEDGQASKLRVAAAGLGDTTRRLAERLADRRLLSRTTSLSSGDFFELAHEALIQAWPALSTWIAQFEKFFALRDEIRSAKKRWAESGESNNRLLPAWMASRGKEILAAAPGLLTSEESAFIGESRRHHREYWLRNARSVSERGEQLQKSGDHVTAGLLALEGLPRVGMDVEIPISRQCFQLLHESEIKRREMKRTNVRKYRAVAVSFSKKMGVFALRTEDGVCLVFREGQVLEMPLNQGIRVMYRDISLSSDARFLAVPLGEHSVEIWDAESGKLVTKLPEHPWPSAELTFSGDGKRIATRFSDNTVKVFDVATGVEVAAIAQEDMPVTAFSLSPNGDVLATGCALGRVRTWILASGTKSHEQQLYQDRRSLFSRMFSRRRQSAFPTRPVNCLAFSHDGARWAAGTGLGSNGDVFVHEVSSGKLLRAFSPPPRSLADGGVYSMDFAPDGRLALALADGTIRCMKSELDTEDFNLISPSSVKQISFAEDGSQIMATDWDHGSIVYWAADPNLEVHSFDVTLTKENSSRDLTLTSVVYHQYDKTRYLSIQGVTKAASAALHAETGRAAMSVDYEGTWILDTSTGEVVSKNLEADPTSFEMFFSDDGSLLAVLDHFNCTVFDTSGGSVVARIKGGRARCSCACFFANDRKLALGLVDHSIEAWDLSTGQLELTFSGAPSPTFMLKDGTLQVQDNPQTGKPPSWRDGNTGPIHQVLASPSGKYIASAANNETILRDASSLEPLCSFNCSRVAFSRNERRMAALNPEGSVVDIVLLETGEQITKISLGNFGAKRIAFTPCGNKIVVASSKTITVADAHDGSVLLEYNVGGGSEYIAFALGGNPMRLDAATALGSFHSHSIPVGTAEDFIEDVAARLPRTLTIDQRDEFHLFR
ncbi:AAA family ATPase [uncultured Ruegeria sp.]|uniref:nSTAND1 domain-containing NTPase n=1 Tax=uncultured Ruegeria sp. TaxID=259304 RepID=UPI002626F9F4|nr:AAA family ATPase [uncultured Ruegeria sp.]